MCVGLTEQDALLAVGVVPLAVTEWFGDAPGFIFPWATDALEAADGELPEILSSTDGVDVEKVGVVRAGPDHRAVRRHHREGVRAPLQDRAHRRPVRRLRRLRRPLGRDGAQHRQGRGQGRRDADDRRRREAADRRRRSGTPGVRGQEGRGHHALRGTVHLRAGGPALADAGRPRVRVPRRRLRRRPATSSGRRSPPRRPRTSTRSMSRSGSTSTRTRPSRTSSTTPPRRPRAAGSTSARTTATTTSRHSFVTPSSIPYVLERYVPQLAAAVDGDPATVPPEAAA